MFVVFDIDGTLADASHRMHHIKQRPKDWDRFFAEVRFDLPIPEIATICRRLWSMRDIRVQFWTGRPERIRHETATWLSQHVLEWASVPFGSLRMRADDDHRPDVLVKEEYLTLTSGPFDPPDLIFEDRKRVTKMFREHGITVCHVAEGDF